MSIRVALHHITEYTYDRRIAVGPQVIRLRPVPHSRTPITAYSLRVQPGGHFLNWQQDPFGNYLARVVFPKQAERMRVEVDVVAEMVTINPFDFFLEPLVERYPFVYEPALAKDLAPYLQSGPDTRLLCALVESVREHDVRTVDYLVKLNQQLQRDVRYIIRMEPGVQSPEETLSLGSGSCRDSAWLLVQVLRRLGLAARFVSGYLIQLKPDQKSLDGPSGAAEDFTDLHAWTEVYLPGAGWVGLDPTSGLFAGEGHIPLACTPDPQSAAPVTGEIEECESHLSVSMSVERIHESPRVTKPYTEEQWQRIEAVGHAIDASLVRGDVRLTMGGEPTFVSIDDMDGAEWNTAALGPLKTKLGRELVERLHRQFAPGGLLHFGQGKWYPGESLPRWAYTCFWRKDGEPMWGDAELFAHLHLDYGYTAADAEAFARDLAIRLGVGTDHLLPAYEDAWYYLWKERRLPANVDPHKSNLADEEERERLAHVFEQGLASVVGYALPIRRIWRDLHPAWETGPWFLRPERMYLLPGDSPMGLRLPLDSLPWVKAGDFPYHHEPDPLAPRGSLPPREAFVRQQPRAGEAAISSLSRPARGQSASWIVRTVLCVEARAGRLHVFMPPVESLDDYLDLLVAVEFTAAEQGRKIVIEGYPPPEDDRLHRIKVTPDPGVIEVNIHPAHNWEQLVHNTTVLYDEARQTRLGTEKFLLDGRHTGTGGGNHIVIGGPTAADSPLLRRPDLLASLVAYWHNHPSLSYLFSGLFIGPTSQAPRVDEARNDALYELEIALALLRRTDSPVPPWQVDRALRNLLVDATGNTHRAEFCIDKLFSPDSPTGRHGLVEMRGFEMPPHARMSLTQQLLIRALVDRFWERPYTTRLVRWGTQLHDRFMLPHFIWADFAEVIEELRGLGYGIEPDWFAPHFEFRFPTIGSITTQNIHVELRQAIEPWHVLGEEAGGGGTVRYVDSSVERLQMLVRGMVDGRHVLTVGGHTIPLHPTGTVGEFLAGVRYRAWQPPSCLHPTIGVHTPLVFDLYDTWSGRAIGGCTYHVAHPGGRNYTTFPVNALEAESRRVARFFPFGHTPSGFVPTPARKSQEFPLTLDLRREAC